jgi:hypothetical protein
MSEVRAKLLRHNNFREKLVSIKVPASEPGTEAEVLEVLVRQPTVAQRNEIMAQLKVGKEGEVKSGDGLSRGLALGIVYCVLDKVARKPIFDISDLDALIGTPSGSWFDDLASAVMGLISDAQDEAKK